MKWVFVILELSEKLPDFDSFPCGICSTKMNEEFKLLTSFFVEVLELHLTVKRMGHVKT